MTWLEHRAATQKEIDNLNKIREEFLKLSDNTEEGVYHSAVRMGEAFKNAKKSVSEK